MEMVSKYCILSEIMVFYQYTLLYFFQEDYTMAKIAPSILSADFGNLERDIRGIAENGGDWVHFM